MTDDELKAIEDGTPADMRYGEGTRAHDVRLLVAEVRRLRGLVKQAEFSNAYGDFNGTCRWCGKDPTLGNAHEDNCPAFTPDGSVR